MPSEPWNDITTLLGGYPQAGDTATELWAEYVQRNLERVWTPPGVRCYMAQDQALPAGGNGVIMNFAAPEDWDTDSFHSTTTNPDRITIPASLEGVYRVEGSCHIRDAAVTDNGGLQNELFTEVLCNGVRTGFRGTVIASDSGNARNIANCVLQCTGEIALSAGDYLQLLAYFNGANDGGGGAGATIDADSSGTKYSYFGVRWVAPLPV